MGGRIGVAGRGRRRRSVCPRSASRCSAIRCTRRARPENLRVEHFPRLTMPVLFVSGTRDAFGTPAELKRHAKKIKGPVDVPLDRDRRPRVQAAEGERPHRGRRVARRSPPRSSNSLRASDPPNRARRVTRMALVRVDRWFAFVDLSGFTSFGDQHGDDESVRVLTLFRGAVRAGRDRLRCAHREMARRRLHARVGRARATRRGGLQARRPARASSSCRSNCTRAWRAAP